MNSPVVKRSIVIAGHNTSVSLEDAFWKGLKEIAATRNVTLSDLVATIDAKCGRSGRYRLADLISRYGRDEKLFAFTADVTANCTRKQARSDTDPCGAICPDLPKVV